mmetsp:Transcript_23605/g.60165  ORF Transcript_23605/g.60165 Transcript_23605/m.60165 type:complete len:406 (+) Transcript_23605:171-1388(+)
MGASSSEFSATDLGEPSTKSKAAAAAALLTSTFRKSLGAFRNSCLAASSTALIGARAGVGMRPAKGPRLFNLPLLVRASKIKRSMPLGCHVESPRSSKDLPSAAAASSKAPSRRRTTSEDPPPPDPPAPAVAALGRACFAQGVRPVCKAREPRNSRPLGESAPAWPGAPSTTASNGTTAHAAAAAAGAAVTAAAAALLAASSVGSASGSEASSNAAAVASSAAASSPKPSAPEAAPSGAAAAARGAAAAGTQDLAGAQGTLRKSRWAPKLLAVMNAFSFCARRGPSPLGKTTRATSRSSAGSSSPSSRAFLPRFRPLRSRSSLPYSWVWHSSGGRPTKRATWRQKCGALGRTSARASRNRTRCASVQGPLQPSSSASASATCSDFSALVARCASMVAVASVTISA